MNSVDDSKIYRLFYPAVPVIVSCTDGGLVFAMPAVSVMSASSDPPLVAVASSPQHSTHKAIAKVGCFSLCWVDASKVRAVEVLGTTGHDWADKLEAAGLSHRRGTSLDVPMIDGAAASLECSLYAREPLGDHELLVGKVEVAVASDDFLDYWRFDKYDPVLYAGLRGGKFTTYRLGRVG